MNCDREGSMHNNGSSETPAVWAGAIVRLDVEDRARVLARLLGFVGPLALGVLGGGAFAKYLRFARRAIVPVTVEDAARVTVSQMHELVRYLQQSHPGIILGRQSVTQECAAGLSA
jgi:hypothetical protein